MENQYNFHGIPSDVINQIVKINTQLSPIIQSAKYYIDMIKPFTNMYSTNTATQLQLLNRPIYKNIAAYKNLINSLSVQTKFMNPAVVKTVNTIKNNLSNIINNNMLDVPVYNADNLLNSIDNLSNYIQETVHELPNTDLTNTAESPSEDLTNNSKSEPDTLDISKQISWKFLIPLIISLISLCLTIFNTHESINASKVNIEFQKQTVNLLQQINKNCEQQINLKSSK